MDRGRDSNRNREFLRISHTRIFGHRNSNFLRISDLKLLSVANEPRPGLGFESPGPVWCRQIMAEYKVKFEVFEGPLDLLLYLIKKEEVDIYEVNLTRLATQFIEYIETMRMLDLEVAGEFLVMAATLMYIKSRELLPVDQQVQVEGEDDGEDPRWELIRQLVEYKKFKDAAAQIADAGSAAGGRLSARSPANRNSSSKTASPGRMSRSLTCSTPSMSCSKG